MDRWSAVSPHHISDDVVSVECQSHAYELVTIRLTNKQTNSRNRRALKPFQHGSILFYQTPNTCTGSPIAHWQVSRYSLVHPFEAPLVWPGSSVFTSAHELADLVN